MGIGRRFTPTQRFIIAVFAGTVTGAFKPIYQLLPLQPDRLGDDGQMQIGVMIAAIFVVIMAWVGLFSLLIGVPVMLLLRRFGLRHPSIHAAVGAALGYAVFYGLASQTLIQNIPVLSLTGASVGGTTALVWRLLLPADKI